MLQLICQQVTNVIIVQINRHQSMCCLTCAQVMVDLSLARGLDYYTGVIFEAKLLSKRTVQCVHCSIVLYYVHPSECTLLCTVVYVFCMYSIVYSRVCTLVYVL